jgi:hypothetical protein
MFFMVFYPFSSFLLKWLN